jgi:nucleotide-binding universal stress UspA family protein
VRTDSRCCAPGRAERDAAAKPSAAAGTWTQATLVATDLDRAETLIQAARDHRAELIVVGHTGSGYATRALLGSTADNVVRHAPCDVLMVR